MVFQPDLNKFFKDKFNNKFKLKSIQQALKAKNTQKKYRFSLNSQSGVTATKLLSFLFLFSQ